MDELSLTAPARPVPTPQRPLLGLTVLAVEDSRFASEALRLLCLRSGARIRRADCVASALRHMSTYRADAAIVDLGLPDGSGLTLIERLAAATPRAEVILATSGVDRSEAEAAALAAGADGFLPKPIESIAAFQQAIIDHLPADRRPMGLREVGTETVQPDRLALVEDLSFAEEMLDTESVPADFIAGFLQGLARSGKDDVMLAQARDLVRSGKGGDIRPGLRALIESRKGERRVV